ncbi:hypothetical protein CCACVL1_04363 [Corchorus capsularis]|uniref:Uncharacterized protein n=1 Tax=Corchorus capsularis TaxID=210143 RepID=A0A1R3JSZ3_COCAP|nr:hypothetical protein CCACVL1_04363 [Corchorus capsularis]
MATIPHCQATAGTLWKPPAAGHGPSSPEISQIHQMLPFSILNPNLALKSPKTSPNPLDLRCPNPYHPLRFDFVFDIAGLRSLEDDIPDLNLVDTFWRTTKVSDEGFEGGYLFCTGFGYLRWYGSMFEERKFKIRKVVLTIVKKGLK